MPRTTKDQGIDPTGVFAPSPPPRPGWGPGDFVLFALAVFGAAAIVALSVLV